MEYQVPQFIEVEDKVVGSFTLRQFIYLAGGAGICVATFLYIPFFIWIFIGGPVAGLSLALAFYKVNGKPFVDILEAAFSYYTGSKLFLWRRSEAAQNQQAPAKVEVPVVTRAAPRLTGNKLHELAWSLDIKNREGSEQP